MSKPILAAFLSCLGTKLTDDEKRIFERSNPVGVTIFARNIENRHQLKLLVQSIKETIGRDDVLIAVDQEGGRVRRLREPDFHPLASASQIGSLDTPTATQIASLHSEIICYDMHSVGLNVNFGPVLDISYPQTTEALSSRCFSGNINTIATLGQTIINNHLSNGILPCIKHLPGHGLATSDPHFGLPTIYIPKDQIMHQLEPFKHCNNAPLGMTAHVLLPTIDKQYPLTQSRIGIQSLIRTAIKFDGFLISDAIDMKALQGNVVDKSLQSLQAGCDCVCYCMGYIDELDALATYCPCLSDESKERLDKATKFLHNTPQIKDIEPVFESYSSVIQQIPAYKTNYDATEVLHQLQRK